MSFPRPNNEADRLEALRQFHILDTDPEPIYDDIVQIAAQLCGTPISAISLVDTERQWFKAQLGLPVRETPRDISFCAHAILDTKTLTVEDATLDQRFRDSPLVTGELGFRFYSGAPLTTASGHAVGALCVIDTKARTLSDAERQALEALGRVVVDLLEHRRTGSALAEALEKARTLSGLLPICSHCKAIRDDAGYWGRVEEFMSEHTEAEFSHSICPACLRLHYPEYADDCLSRLDPS